MRWAAFLIAAVVITLAGCSSALNQASDPSRDSPSADDNFSFPAAPVVTAQPLEPKLKEALNRITSSLFEEGLDRRALEMITESGDARLAWLVSDLLRFVQGGDDEVALVTAFQKLTGVDPRKDPAFRSSAWLSVTNHLIAWDLPSPPHYRECKADLFLQVEPAWGPFFADEDSAINWRLVSWGGVFIDDRPLGTSETCPRGCIPALDDPEFTDAAGGNWYPDDAVVFGVVVGDEAAAFPKNIMEVHEMVNVTIGGRRLGIPYCTLCGSAQAYFTDAVPSGVATPVLRTSGLLVRSNKVMYDLNTNSVFDTFTGRALSGPLQDRRVVLRQATVEVSTWGDWKQAHPDTKIVAEGRDYPLDPLGGRDDNGPIFPVGRPDPRLPVQTSVLGVISPQGTPVAFPAEQAQMALQEGRRVAAGGIEVATDGGGLRAEVIRTGEELPAHQAFWFAWSQFHPDTLIWTPLDG